MTTVSQSLDALEQTSADMGQVLAEVRQNLRDWQDRFCARMGITVSSDGPGNWMARYGETGPCGLGRTKSDAISDLLDNHAKPAIDEAAPGRVIDP